MKKYISLAISLIFIAIVFSACTKNFDTGALNDGLDSKDSANNGDTGGSGGEQPAVTGSPDYYFKSTTFSHANQTFYHGDSFTVNYEVKNQGDQPGEEYTITAIIQDANCGEHNNWCIVNQVTNQPALASLASSGVQSITFPVLKELGTGSNFNVKIRIDRTHSEPSEQTTNDYVVFDGKITVLGRPDLIVSTPSFSTTGGIGSGSISFSFVNQGSAATSGTLFYNVFLTLQNSTNGEVLSGSAPKSNIISGSIAQNGTSSPYNVTMYELCNNNLDCAILPQNGPVYAVVVVDSNNSLTELDENNNRAIVIVRN